MRGRLYMKHARLGYSVDWAQHGVRDENPLNTNDGETAMTGIQFITDAKGRKTAAVIDLKKHSALWEDIQDVPVSRSRRLEKRIPLEKVKSGLVASGRLFGEI